MSVPDLNWRFYGFLSANEQKSQTCRDSILITLNVHLDPSIAVPVKRIISRLQCINAIFSCVIKYARLYLISRHKVRAVSRFFLHDCVKSGTDWPRSRVPSAHKNPRFENQGHDAPGNSVRHRLYRGCGTARWMPIVHDYLPASGLLRRVATATSILRHSRGEYFLQYSFTRQRRRWGPCRSAAPDIAFACRVEGQRPAIISAQEIDSARKITARNSVYRFIDRFLSARERGKRGERKVEPLYREPYKKLLLLSISRIGS